MLKNLNILLVDDSEIMRAYLSKYLRNMGAENISQAEDGKKGLESVGEMTAQKNKFDLILLDWTMPGMSGLEFLKKVRSNPFTKDIPVLMVTAEAKSSNIEEAMREGASGYLSKKFNYETFREHIENVLSTQQEPGQSN